MNALDFARFLATYSTMNFSDTIIAAEKRVADSGLTMPEFWARCEIHRATWQRWKNGKFWPGMRAWSRVEAQLNRLKKRAA